MQESEFMDWAIKGLLAAAFATWAAVIKYFGGRYISSLDAIEARLGRLELKLAVLEATHKQEGQE